jgi:hypothetical protein
LLTPNLCQVRDNRPILPISPDSLSKPAPCPDSAPSPARRSRRLLLAAPASAAQQLRILERLTAGASVAEIAGGERLTIRRVRQLIAEEQASGRVDPAAGFAQLQLARLGDAMRIAHTKMMKGDLQALDRFVGLVAEFDRDHGFGRAPIVAPHARVAAAKRNGRQPLEKTESGEAGGCAGTSL